MELSKDKHIVNKLLKLSEDEYSKVSLSAYFINKDKNKDSYYFSKLVEIDESIEVFLKGHIIKILSKLKKENGNSFPVQNYNQEFQLTDFIGRFNIEEYTRNSSPNKAVEQLSLMRSAMAKDELENINKAMFQIIALHLDGEKVSFCFYKSVKKQAKTKKMALWSSEKFISVEKDMVEFGGNFSFFMDDTNIFIIDPRHFEWAFDYKDHITENSRINIDRVTAMDFFPDEATKRFFKQAASHQLFARGIASMEVSTLEHVETYFDERVKELKAIKDKRDNIEDQEKKAKFKQEIGELNELIDFIDFSNNKVIFREKDDPKPLLHFFQDKIVESFLTKRVRVAMKM